MSVLTIPVGQMSTKWETLRESRYPTSRFGRKSQYTVQDVLHIYHPVFLHDLAVQSF